MSEFFGEATVKLRPDLTGFITQLRTDLKAAIEAVENGARPPVIRIRPALTRDFVGDLRRQVNAAVDQAQRGVKPITVRAQIADFPRGQLREISRRSVAGLGGAAGGAASLGTAARGAQQFQDAATKVLNTEKLLTSAFADQATMLGTVSRAERRATIERVAGARSGRQLRQEILEESAAFAALTRARRALSVVELTAEGTRSRSTAVRRAEFQILAALALAHEESAAGIEAESRAMLRNLAILDQRNRALTESAGAAARSARSQEQLRRGALATSLSFLGIRGATLAASASFLAGAAAIGIFAKALQNATEFSTNLSVLRATTAATAQEMSAAADAARALGADISLPGVTAADAAEAMVELARAGLSVQESIAGTRGVLQLATAAAIDNAQAVELAANAINAFQLAGRDATHVADVFANAANAAQGSIVDIGIAFQQAAAAGRQVGLTFEDTSAFLTVLAQNGLRGSDAGTSLRTALIRLIRPTADARDRLRELGVEVRDAQGNLRPDVFIQLAEATRNLGPAARDAVIALVGGQDAFRAISILGRQSIEDFIALRRELRQQGTAADLAAARNEGLRGSLDALSNTLSTAGTRIGQGVTPSLQGLVAGLTTTTAAIADSSEAAELFSGVLDSIELAGSALGTTVQALATPLAALASSLEAVSDAVGVPTLLAALAAYKLFPPVLRQVDRVFTSVRIATVNAAFAMRPATFAAAALTTTLRSLATGLPLLEIGIAAAAAGLIFLITRETAAERATRQLAEATRDLANAQSALRSARGTRQDTALSQNAARLGLLEAQATAGRVRAALANSRAARGSFERRRLELELAVALDDVAIAENRLRDAITQTVDAREVARQAEANARDATLELVTSIQQLVEVERQRGRRPQGGRNPAAAAQREAEAIRNVTDELLDRAEAARQEGSAESIRLAQRLEILAAVTKATKDLAATDAVIDIVVNADNAQQALQAIAREFDLTAQQARNILANALGEGAAGLPEAVRRTSEDIREDLRVGMHNAGRTAGESLVQAMIAALNEGAPGITAAAQNVVGRALGRLQGLQRQATRLDIAGAGPQERLANAIQQEQEARRALAALERRGAAEVSINRALDRVAAAVNLRRSIEAEIRAASEEAADEARKAADAADDAALARLERTRNAAQERLTDAQATTTLADDIRRTRELRNLVHRQINQIKQLVKDRETERDAIRALQAIERDLNRALRDLARDRRAQIQERIAESIQLDIDFAVTTENLAAEIRARRREIERLRKLQAETKKGSVEWRRYRNAIAEQQKAIDEATKKTKDRNRSAEALFFEFLQRQQGFAANLLGNVIPLNFTGGLVGNTSPTTAGGSAGGAGLPGGPIEGAAARRVDADLGAAGAAGGPPGPTRGQGASQIELLRQILRTLREIQGGRAHPEARSNHQRGGATMDIL